LNIEDVLTQLGTDADRALARPRQAGAWQSTASTNWKLPTGFRHG
jgi:hypothetical protein